MFNNNPERFSATIRILAGGYLVYLGYRLIDAVRNSVGTPRILYIVFMLLFLVGGSALTLFYLRVYLRTGKETPKEPEQQFTEAEKDPEGE